MMHKDLTEEEIANLALEIRCCYFLHPWNQGMTGTTVEEWAEQLGFTKFASDSVPVKYATRIAIEQANKLIRFVKEMQKSRSD